MKNDKLQSLQGIRALGTIGIFMFHSGFLPNGTFPVTLFFMLSGFVMYYTKYDLSKYKNYGQWFFKYVVKKIKQFYPLHILTFIISLIIGGYFTKELSQDFFTDVFLNLFLIHPFFETKAFIFNGLSWYLAVLFFLYIIGYYCIKIINKTCVSTSKILIIIFGIIYSLNMASVLGIDLYLYSNPIYRLLDFVVGMLCAKAFIDNEYHISNYSRLETLIIIAFFVQYSIGFFIISFPGYYSLLFSFALLIFSRGQGCISKILTNQFFDTIAKYSFEFYMVHELILRIFRKIFTSLELFYPVQCLVIAVPALFVSIILSIVIKKVSQLSWQ